MAGVRVATQTPPMRGGRRVVFISIDDGTGCVDSVFFHEAQEHAGPLLFGTRLLLIRGTTRRTGPRGISISASMAWDLSRTRDPAVPGPGGRDPGLPGSWAAGSAGRHQPQPRHHRAGRLSGRVGWPLQKPIAWTGLAVVPVRHKLRSLNFE